MVSRWLIALVVLVAIGLVSVALQPGRNALPLISNPGELPPSIASFASQRAGEFITYRDAVYGFSLPYPKGYLAEVDGEPGTRLLITATTFDDSEAITVATLPEPYSDSDFQKAEGALPGSSFIGKKQVILGGKPAYLLDYLSAPLENSNYTVHLKQAIIPECHDANGTAYTLYLTAAVPQPLWADLSAMDYMIYSLRCRS